MTQNDRLWIMSAAALVCSVTNEVAGRGAQMWGWLVLAIIFNVASRIRKD